MAEKTHLEARISTGMSGLDDILGGGLDPDRLYLVEGTPGSGKTRLALQFLLDGVRRNEKVLYITLSESEAELRLVAERHGWSLDGVSIFQLVPPEASHGPDHEVTLFHPSEMELGETTKTIFDQVHRNEPVRVVFDSLSEMRLLAQNSLWYRRQILALKHFFAGRKCTVLLLDDLSSRAEDLQLHSIAHGVISLEQLALDYGAERRRLRVTKMRGPVAPKAWTLRWVAACIEELVLCSSAGRVLGNRPWLWHSRWPRRSVGNKQSSLRSTRGWEPFSPEQTAWESPFATT